MSLLMDALRRAERAKEQSQPEPPGEGSPAGLAAVDLPSALPAASTGAESGVVTTTATGGEAALALSIDDVVPAAPAQAADAAVTRPDTGPHSTPSPRTATAKAVTHDQATQLQARHMLAARARQTLRRRLAVTAGGGVALLVIVLVLVFFEVAVSTGRLQGPQVAVPLAEPEDMASVPAVEATDPVAVEMPAGAPDMGSSATAAPLPARRAGRPVATPAHIVSAPVVPAVRSEPPMPAAVREDAPASPVVIVRNAAEDPLQALLAQAFDDYQAGDDARAEAGYRQALARDANNRDALLGLAALAQRGDRYEEARMYYRHLLELNPLDSAPAAGLIALQGGVNPVNDESRIKLLLRQEPDAAYLHFALGTVYVGQGRWAEAQQAFFDAYRRDPANADHAFNLAVCLDRLGQPLAALEYYRRAIDLARGRAAGFSASQAAQRIETLTKAARGEAG